MEEVSRRDRRRADQLGRGVDSAEPVSDPRALPPSGLLQVRPVGAGQPVRMRSQTRVDRFLASPERVDVGMIGGEAGRHLGTFGNGAVAGDHDIDVSGGLAQPVERGLGTGEARASRTGRRCTPYFRDKARIDSCCYQLSRRIRSNSSCWDKDIHSTQG